MEGPVNPAPRQAKASNGEPRPRARAKEVVSPGRRPVQVRSTFVRLARRTATRALSDGSAHCPAPQRPGSATGQPIHRIRRERPPDGADQEVAITLAPTWDGAVMKVRPV